MPKELPKCGLYRTGLALAGQEEAVAAGILVYFHNHSDQGPAMVQTPHENTHNRWQFHDRGWAASDAEFLNALVPLKAEGLYVNAKHLHISREEIIPSRTLLQLGYNRRGDTLLFIGRFRDNVIEFPEKGYAFEDPAIQELLEPAGFLMPRREDPADLH